MYKSGMFACAKSSDLSRKVMSLFMQKWFGQFYPFHFVTIYVPNMQIDTAKRI